MAANRDFNPYSPSHPPEGLYSLDTLQGSSAAVNTSRDDLPGAPIPALSSTAFLTDSRGAYGAIPEGNVYSAIASRKQAVPVVVVVVAVVVAIYVAVIKPKQQGGTSSDSESNSGDKQHGGGSSPRATLQIGRDGSTVTKADGSTFKYNNSFGGYWAYNSADPFDNSARPNSWTPALNETWQWGKDRVYGVNLGGLFVLEPFISPSIFQDYPSAKDEWTLSTSLAAAGQLEQVLEDHYKTFISEEDIAQIVGAGLNWIRLPILFWAIETSSDVGQDGSGQTVAEPFLVRMCWKYILRILGWARKYGLRVLLDLHTIPGSQNGFNHSGRKGTLNWLYGTMGLANAQRSLDYIRVITEFISQPEYRELIPIFGVMNEPFLPTVGRPQIESFNYQTYQMIRNITGVGEGNGPMIAFHTGFDKPVQWEGFLSGADRIVLDDHPYFAFTGAPNREPVNVTADGSDGMLMGGKWPKQACDQWGPERNASRKAFGITLAGEFSNAINDCGLYVIGVNVTAVYGPDCEYWSDASGWSDSTKQGLMNFAMASMDALGDWFYWTWKIGESKAGSVQAPLWSYKLGLEGGWMPKDPRDAVGACARYGYSPAPYDGTFESWMTGGVGAGTIAPSATQSIPAWPPSLSSVPTQSASLLPQYTSTATMVTLSPPTFSATSGVTPTASVGSGWANPKDTTKAVGPIPGCQYPFAWDAVDAPLPASGCVPS
ncbi:glycoside hydrolase [Cerioporus squamosus]|nr:glycoside hydrolase [Cerioporus squamosus]